MKQPLQHYHKILIDDEADEYFSEMFHSHEGGDIAHGHDIEICRGYLKVEERLPAPEPK